VVVTGVPHGSPEEAKWSVLFGLREDDPDDGR
jgi:hypothetical protein